MVCCLYGCFVYPILSYSFGSIFITIYHVYGCMFCMLPFNFINYVYCYVDALLLFYIYICSNVCILFHCVVLYNV